MDRLLHTEAVSDSLRVPEPTQHKGTQCTGAAGVSTGHTSDEVGILEAGDSIKEPQPEWTASVLGTILDEG